MKKFLIITLGSFLVLASPARAQAGLQIDSLFNGSLVPASRITEYEVSGRELKPYNLDYFRSVRFQATDQEIKKITSWLEGDVGAFAVNSMRKGSMWRSGLPIASE